MKHRSFVLITGKLRSEKEAAEFLDIIKDYAYSERRYRWVYFPMFRVKRRKGYEIEVIYLGRCSRRQKNRLAALEAKLKRHFKSVSIKHLAIKKLKEI